MSAYVITGLCVGTVAVGVGIGWVVYRALQREADREAEEWRAMEKHWQERK